MLHQLREADRIEDGVEASFGHLLAGAEPAFDPRERQVIALAARDSLSSLEAPSWLGRLGARVFGMRRMRHALADPRLEALRRAAVVARHRRHLPDAMAADLRRLGFTGEQVRALERLAIG